MVTASFRLALLARLHASVRVMLVLIFAALASFALPAAGWLVDRWLDAPTQADLESIETQRESMKAAQRAAWASRGRWQ